MLLHTHRISPILFLLFLFFMSIGATAQKRPACMPGMGFWQLIDRPQEKNVTTVQFYSAQSQLIYEEKCEGTLDLQEKQTRIQLNQVLATALQTWKKKKALQKDQGWLAIAMRVKYSALW